MSAAKKPLPHRRQKSGNHEHRRAGEPANHTRQRKAGKVKTQKNAATRTAPDCRGAGPTPEEITSCAHLIWEQEGRPGGRDLDHWLHAEAQLQQNRRQDAPEK
jgi:hypothetical protein